MMFRQELLLKNFPMIGPVRCVSRERKILNPVGNRDMYDKKTMTGTNVRSLL